MWCCQRRKQQQQAKHRSSEIANATKSEADTTRFTPISVVPGSPAQANASQSALEMVKIEARQGGIEKSKKDEAMKKKELDIKHAESV